MREQTAAPGRIAGITPLDIADNAAAGMYRDAQDFIAALHKRYAHANAFYMQRGTARDADNAWDARMAHLHLGYVGDDSLYKFLLSRTLLTAIETAAVQKGGPLSNTELLWIALDHAEGAVESSFTAGAMNAINASYYASPIAFSAAAGVAVLFAHNRPLNFALGVLLAEVARAKRGVLRVKEVCSSSRVGHWQIVAHGAKAAGLKKLDVRLSDFAKLDVPAEVQDRALHMSAEQYSLFDPLPVLPAAERFDAMIATYGFDSVWLPEDIRVRKVGNDWYQALHRVKVADWNPRREELIRAMRAGRPLPNATPQDYDGIYVEEAYEKINLNEHPFGAYIKRRAARGAINFPGGLIKRTVEAFELQLHKSGVFISADTGDFGVLDTIFMEAAGITGIGARYKGEDYVLAKEILEREYGFEVHFYTLAGLARDYLPERWTDRATPFEVAQLQGDLTAGVMIVKRSRTKRRRRNAAY
ncbi:MAG TPA: hypothetical protein VJ836_05985 [Candidatus Saccharimonadales bacterium]|nr:hypothetical protein [Candidatus Saccharimonadales bacterium]